MSLDHNTTPLPRNKTKTENNINKNKKHHSNKFHLLFVISDASYKTTSFWNIIMPFTLEIWHPLFIADQIINKEFVPLSFVRFPSTAD